MLQNIGLIQKYPGSYKTAGIFWSWRQESNLQPADYKSAALPIELHQRVSLVMSNRKEEKNGDAEGARTLDLQRDRLAF